MQTRGRTLIVLLLRLVACFNARTCRTPCKCLQLPLIIQNSPRSKSYLPQVAEVLSVEPLQSSDKLYRVRVGVRSGDQPEERQARFWTDFLSDSPVLRPKP